MKTITTILVIIVVLFQPVMAQVPSADKVARSIPTADTYTTNAISSYITKNLPSDSERVRAIFVWVANNLAYDVDKARTREINEKVPLSEILTTRKAVCQGYAELFIELCSLAKVNAVLISGYTKNNDGSVAELSHAWVAAKLNNKWHLYDPTWAAGQVRANRFYPQFNERFYDVEPTEMIRDHMPFDPMFQLVDRPIFYHEFNAGKVFTANKPYFNFNDTIANFYRLDTFNQQLSIVRRINSNGDKNQLVYERLNIAKKNQQSGESALGFNGAVLQFNKATKLFNHYIDLKNKRFSEVNADGDIRQIMDSVLLYVKSAFTMLSPVVASTPDQTKSLSGINSDLTRFYRRVEDESIFLKKYLATEKSARRLN